MRTAHGFKSHILKSAIMAFILLLVVCQKSKVSANSPQKKSYKLTPVAFSDVKITDEFWSARMETNRKVTIGHCLKQCEKAGCVENFINAAGQTGEKFKGIFFADSDIYKTIEAAAYSLRTHPDAELERYVDELINKIAAAQWEDGYLNTYYSLPKRQTKRRWTQVRSQHELYCAGHFIEAAVAYYQTTGKKKILDIAVKLADHIDSIFGPGKRYDVPGHEEIELALVKLYKVTDDERYFKLAKFFIDERGYRHNRRPYGTYSQDHAPVVQQREAVGHAVRATYLYCGMADVAALTSNADYVKSLDEIWEDVVSGKLYLTGGIGARHRQESFGHKYDLPNRTAYCETCAAIGNALWNYRMFLLHDDAKYIDVLERIIYNGLISGVSLSGDKFFYVNPLESVGKESRNSWFYCACCPPNAARFIASLGERIYAHKESDIYVNLFIAGTATITTKNNTVVLTQQSRYPWDGDVKISVEPKKTEEFSIYVRIPGWAQNRPVPSDLYHYSKKNKEKAALKVNDEQIQLKTDKGFVRINRIWQKGDEIHLSLPMPIRRVLSCNQVEEDKEKVALERGPIVYCAEWPDNKGRAINIILKDNVKLKAEYKKELLGGVCAIRGEALAYKQDENGKIKFAEHPLVAIPYYAWAHRGKGEMAVWLWRSTKAVKENLRTEEKSDK